MGALLLKQNQVIAIDMFAIFFVGGLIVGSFLNVVIYRLNAIETLFGRSHCAHCKKLVRWYDNIPLVSFILLGTRCRDCKEKISWQYPAVELATGILFGLVGSLFFVPEIGQSWFLVGFYLFMIALFVVLFVYDLLYMEVPMIIIWIGLVVSIVFGVGYYFMPEVSARFSFLSLDVMATSIASVLVFFFFFCLSYFSKEKWMGSGDAYVAILCSFFVGWPLVLAALMLAFTLGSIIGIGLVLFQGKTLHTQVPFAPFLIAGALLALILDRMFPLFNALFTLIYS